MADMNINGVGKINQSYYGKNNTTNSNLAIQPLSNDVDRNLSAQIDYFNNNGNKPLSEIFSSIKNEKDTLFGGFKNNLLNQFDQFQSMLNPSFNQFLNQSGRIANEILPGIQAQQALVQQKFGPDGEFTNAATSYYKNLLDSVNGAINGSVASAGNQGIRSGASQSSINQAINQARSQGLGDLAKIKGEELSQQQALYNNLFQLQDGLRQQTFNYNNELVRNPLLQLNQMLSGLGTQVLTGLQGYDGAQLQQQLQIQAEQRQLANQLALQRATPKQQVGYTPEQLAALMALKNQKTEPRANIATSLNETIQGQPLYMGTDGNKYINNNGLPQMVNQASNNQLSLEQIAQITNPKF